jgi:hypothetical protein
VITRYSEDRSGWAVFSDCQRYRYELGRTFQTELFNNRGYADFVMLNPSTATHEVLDPTLRRCHSFSEVWGCCGFRVFNMFGFRATDPAELLKVADPIGPENRSFLAKAGADARDGRSYRLVVGWGSAPLAVECARMVVPLLQCDLWCLGTTKAGHPRHPLYVRGDTQLARWRPRV